jgi:hypothetical protein
MSKKRMTKAQREWCKNYQRDTTFEPLMDDFLAGTQSFKDAAWKSCFWFEDWASDTHLNITRHIPGDES